MRTIKVLLLIVMLGALTGCAKQTCTCILDGEEQTVKILEEETCLDLEPQMELLRGLKLFFTRFISQVFC